MAPNSTGVSVRLTSPVVMLPGGPEYERARARRRRGLVRPSNSTTAPGQSPAPSRAPSQERGRSLAPSAAASRAASPMGRITEDGPPPEGLNSLAAAFVPPGPSRGRSASRRDESPAPLREASQPRGRSSSAGPGAGRVREPVTTGSGTAEEEAAADEPEPAFLRGLLTLNLSKPSRIREINVKLKGVARTDWPEGIGPRRLDVMEENIILNVTHSFFSAAANNMDRRAASVDPHSHRNHDDCDHRARRAASVMPSRDTSTGRAYLGQDSAIHHRSASVDGLSLGLQLGPLPGAPLSRIASSTELNGIAEAGQVPLPSVIGREWGPSPAYEAVPSTPGSPIAGPVPADGLADVPELGMASASLQLPHRRPPSRQPLRRGDSSPVPSPLGPSRVPSGEFNPLNRTSSTASGESSASQSSATSGSNRASPGGHPATRPDSISERGRASRLLPHLSIDPSAGPSTTSSGTPASYPTSPAGSIHSPSRRTSGVPGAGPALALPSALRNASGSRPPSSRSASSKGARFSLAGLSDALRGKSVSRTRDSSRDTRTADESRGRSRDASPDTVRNSDRGVSRGRKTALKSIRDALTGADGAHDDGAGSDEEGDGHGAGHVHNWKEFRAGTYTYPISIAVPGSLPPSILADFGFVTYTLKASVVRAGALTANLSSSTEVLLVSAPGSEDTEEAESIVVERFWETQMKYHVALSGKAFPIGGRIPITIRLSPMAKVKLYRITATLEQKTTYFAVGRKLTRHETPKKFPLLRVDFKDPKEALLPILSDDPNVLKEHPLKDWFVNVGGSESNETPSCLDPLGPWALESFIPLPDCSTRVGFTTNHEKANISVSHVVKVTLRVERGDDDFLDSKGKRKLWDVIIEAPVHILSCRCTATILPPYAPAPSTPGPSGSSSASSSSIITPFSQPPDCGAHGTPRPHPGQVPLHLTPIPPAPGRSASRERVEPPTTTVEQTLLFERLVSGEVGASGEVPPSYREVAVDEREEEEEEEDGRGRSVTRAV